MTKKALGHNTGLAKVAVECYEDTYVVKIATFAKPETVIQHFKTDIWQQQQQQF
jgi:hypothetical protein